MTEGIVTIKNGREKPIRNQHPWIFSGAVARADKAVNGELVTVVDSRGHFLARGYWNAKSQIQARILSWDDVPIDDDWWHKTLSRAMQLRLQQNSKFKSEHSAYRLVNAENDFVPGLVIDRYGDWFVLQAQTLFIDKRKERIAEYLHALFGARNIYERSDIDLRRQEGLDKSVGLLRGGPLPDELVIDEGARFLVDIAGGQKTGFYLDQRENRQKLSELVGRESNDRAPVTLLNLFCYSGGFAVSAMRQGHLRAINVDSSWAALALAEKNVELNGLRRQSQAAESEFIQADGFDYLRYCVEEGQRFDIIALDPPKFALHKKQVGRAARGYKDLNLNAIKLVKEGGCLMTFSCSGAVSRDLFQKIVFSACADSGRQAQIVSHLQAAPDHPVALTFPEGEYLKGLLLRVL